MNENKQKPLWAKLDYLSMIQKSWTWARLTEQEQTRFLKEIDHPVVLSRIQETLKNIQEEDKAYNEIRDIYETCYHMFLAGCQYDPLHWREKPEPMYNPSRDEIRHVLEYLAANQNSIIQFLKGGK